MILPAEPTFFGNAIQEFDESLEKHSASIDFYDFDTFKQFENDNEKNNQRHFETRRFQTSPETHIFDKRYPPFFC